MPLWALSPGGPFYDYGPAKMSLGAFYDHSGQTIYDVENSTQSVLNSTGIQATYAPWRWIQLGGSLGTAEFDHEKNKTSIDPFNGTYQLYWGGSAKLYTPRFAKNRMLLLMYGSVNQVEAKDGSNIRDIWEYHAGLAAGISFTKTLSMYLGSEFYFLDGEQKNSLNDREPFGNQDLVRGLLAFEYVPKNSSSALRGSPYISFEIRPTPNYGYSQSLGLKNTSLSVSIGVTSFYLYGKYKAMQDEKDY